jgi:hypothetical protein
MAPERSKKIVTKKINRVYKTVNKLTSYEQLISEKIQQVPVPDMTSSIWNQIEQGLDDMDPGSGNDEQQPAPKKSGGGSYPGNAHYFYIAGCFIIGVIIFVIVITQRKQNPAPLQPGRSQPQEQILPGSSINPYPDSNKNSKDIIAGKPLFKNNDPAKTVLLPFTRSTIDSITNLPVFIHERDSLNLFNPGLTAQPRPDSLVIQPPFIPLRKPRGVTGISDSDYKIKGVKKDSSQP